MTGQRVGYVRVSSIDQNPDRQLEGVMVDKKFVECASGKDTNRPQFAEMMRYIREGDTLIVHSMDRLARNLDDLRRTIQSLIKRSISVEFVHENLKFTGEASPIAVLMLSIMGSFAEFERGIIRERQREGIELAKKRGAYKGRRRSLTNDEMLKVKEKIEFGVSKARVAREFGVSTVTIYQYLREMNAA